MSFVDFLVIIGMFLIRIGIPIMITIAVAVVLRRLDAKWEVELRQQAAADPQPQPEKPVRPSVGIQYPQPLPATLTAIDIFGKPCWDIHDCQPAQKATCPAVAQPESPCWLAKFQSMGKMPDQCYNCGIYLATQPFLSLPSSGQQLEIRH
ncbi:MAG: hypothetical protein J5I90_08950 [Caldilineales bacterium]|nr:hypothetical protein [Caldilineales bacterium]